MTFWAAVALVSIIVLVLIGCCALVIWLEKKFPPKKYDERQMQIRGKAYKWAFITCVVYFLAISVLDYLLPGGLQADMFLLIWIGIFLGAVVCSVYCILNDAEIPLFRSAKTSYRLNFLLGVLDLINAVMRVNGMRLSLTEELQIIEKEFNEVTLDATRNSAWAWGYLIMGIVFLCLGTIEWIRYRRHKED